MKAKLFILLTLVFLISVVSAIPQTFNIHGKLTDSSGTALSGTYNMTFKIYDAYTGGNTLWSVINQSITSDSNGVYSTILTAIDLNFSEQYYLGITVESDDELSPRTNLTSSGYTFRANVTDYLDTTKNYEMANLTISQKITFALGEIIDNIVDGWVRVTGGLNVTGNVTAPYFIGDGSQLTNVNGSGVYVPYTGATSNVNLGAHNFSVNTNTLFVNKNTGNVGIGTTGPGAKLEVYGATDSKIFLQPAAIGNNPIIGARVATGGYLGFGIRASLNPTSLGGNTEDVRMVIDYDGNVGIGTTGPLTQLHISGAATGANGIARFDSTAADYVRVLVNAVTAGADSQLSFLEETGTKWSIGNDAGTDNFIIREGYGAFGTNDYVTVEKTSGNVGIGTTGPQNKLNVIGDANVTGAMIISSMNITVEGNGDVNVW